MCIRDRSSLLRLLLLQGGERLVSGDYLGFDVVARCRCALYIALRCLDDVLLIGDDGIEVLADVNAIAIGFLQRIERLVVVGQSLALLLQVVPKRHAVLQGREALEVILRREELALAHVAFRRSSAIFELGCIEIFI